MVTAYDYPSAVHVDLSGVDILLVGDSVGMVVHGHETTLPVTLDDMLLHCRSVARGAQRPFLIGDLPFGSYERSPQQAIESATRLLKEGGMDAVKLEGGGPARVAAAKAVTEAGIAVMGHVGLTPQAISSLGGFRPQGRTAAEAIKVREAVSKGLGSLAPPGMGSASLSGTDKLAALSPHNLALRRRLQGIACWHKQIVILWRIARTSQRKEISSKRHVA
eukprot:gene4257-5241_t